MVAVTQWYETCLELFKAPRGQFMFHLPELHEKSGPIVRISPNEVHIQDSQFYHILYSQALAWDRPQRLQHHFNTPQGLLSIPRHQIHRRRRAALNPFFSKRKISLFAPFLQRQAEKLVNRLQNEYQNTGKILHLNKVHGFFAADGLVSLSLNTNYNWLESKDFHCAFVEAMVELMDGTHTVTQFPFLARTISAVPISVLSLLSPAIRAGNAFGEEIRRQIKRILDEHEEKGSESQHTAVFSAIVDSALPAEEISLSRLQNEAFGMTGAGVETISTGLSITTFHISDSPLVLNHLCMELKDAIPDPNHFPSLDRLERLPFLTACIEEGTKISMDNYSVSHDEILFPDSFKFVPEQWLNNPATPDGRKLKTYMVSFGRGTRPCIGMNLALANADRNLGLKLYETDRTAVDCFMDRFVPRAKPGTEGVRVLVK